MMLLFVWLQFFNPRFEDLFQCLLLNGLEGGGKESQDSIGSSKRQGDGGHHVTLLILVVKRR